MTNKNKPFLHALNATSVFSNKELSIISCAFKDDFEKAWNMKITDLRGKVALEKLQEFMTLKKTIDVHSRWDELQQAQIQIAHITDQEYPALLREIHNPPSIIYYRGNLCNAHFKIAMVGSRKMSPYGKQCVEQILCGLDQKVCIVSGLAYGIDSYAHKTSLDCGLKTIAVLGSGIDEPSIYPRLNRSLAKEILAAGGSIVSEYTPGTAARAQHFPARNRIISGLSKAVIIVEAGIKSGALITAKFALEQSRDVFAVPGSIFHKLSAGANNLIKNWAKPITGAEDLINEYSELNIGAKDQTQPQTLAGLNLLEQKVLTAISVNKISSVDGIIQRTGLRMSELNTALTLLEMKNKIRNLGAGGFGLNLTTANQDS